MRALSSALLAALLVGCAPAPAANTPAPATAPRDAGEGPFTRTAATLAAGACSQLDGRLFSLASGADGVVDLFVLVKTCAAHAERDDVVLDANAYAWLAVDRDLGAVSVREFVHVTLGAQVRLGAKIAYAGDHAEVTLTPRPGAKLTIEPVGILEVEALNWASLLALELAPSAGASAEAIAKRKLREEAEGALTRALAVPIVVSYDGRTGDTWFGSERGGAASSPAASSPASPLMRVVRRGMALTKTIEPSTSPLSARVRVTSGSGLVAVRAVCRASAERMLDADRRGEPVATVDFTTVEGEATVKLPPMPCPWTIAARALDDRPLLVSIEAPVVRPTLMAHRPDRWISLDVVEAEIHEEVVGPLAIELSGGAFQYTLHAKAPVLPPTIVILSENESITVRALRPGPSGADTPVAALRLPVDDAGDVDRRLSLRDGTGFEVAKLRVRARVRGQGTP